MYKKIILLLISMACLELTSLAVFNSSMKAWVPRHSAAQNNDLSNFFPDDGKPLPPASPPQTMTVNYLDKKIEMERQVLALWVTREVQPSFPEIGKFLTSLAQEINRPAQDAVLSIEDDRAMDFKPDMKGQALDMASAQKLIIASLLAGQSEIDLPVVVEEPKVKLGDLNNLGIKELVVTGKSDFTGSSAARMVNIRAGSSQYNGVIIKQGEEFSFNKYLGPVDAKHGFLPELVIKTINGQPGSVPEFGGGLCQVSTTAFRAAFFAGLPITARRNHSFAVRYYEWIDDDLPRSVGLDATIYSGVQDLKFINDTPSAILVWTRMEGKRLYFDFYGTKDDREVLVDGPYTYDKKGNGAVKATVTRTVKKSGAEPAILTLDSKYVPPIQATTVVQYPQNPSPTPPPAEDNQTINPPNT